MLGSRVMLFYTLKAELILILILWFRQPTDTTEQTTAATAEQITNESTACDVAHEVAQQTQQRTAPCDVTALVDTVNSIHVLGGRDRFVVPALPSAHVLRPVGLRVAEQRLVCIHLAPSVRHRGDRQGTSHRTAATLIHTGPPHRTKQARHVACLLPASQRCVVCRSR